MDYVAQNVHRNVPLSVHEDQSCRNVRKQYEAGGVPAAHRELLSSFFKAVQSGDLGALTQLLTEEVTLWADGGGKVKAAALQPINGRDAVTAFILKSAQAFRSSLPQDLKGELIAVNGQPALVMRSGERAFSVFTIEVEAGRIQMIRFMANPDKLGHV